MDARVKPAHDVGEMPMRWIAGLLAICIAASPAAADTIRIVIPYAPGGALDPLARILANGLGKLRTGDSIVVENIGGAGGIVGMSTVAKAAPDGRTVLFSPSGNIVISPWLQQTPYDVTTAFEPIALIGSVKSAMIVRVSLGVSTLAELIALSRQGTKLTYGSPGIGTSPHISGAILNHAAGISITHVPYRGLGPALNDIVGGHIDAITTSVIGVLPYVQGGTARALATFDTERSDRLPDVPTTVELGFPELVMPQWYALLAPAGLAPDVRKTFEAQVLAVLRSREVEKQLATSGVAGPKGAAELQAILDADFKKWPALLPKLGITGQ
jgi:tripartite-type tricarboxylate transporter receptor subunit TctC